MLMLAVLLHASPAEPGLRPVRADGKPIAAYAKRGKPIAAYAKRGEPIANEQGASRNASTRFSWDALNVTNATTCGWEKCYFQGEREEEGWLVGRNEMNNIWDMLKYKLKYWSSAWEFAEELRADFGVDHLLTAPPFLATLSPQQAKYLNARMHAAPGQTGASHNQRDSWHNRHIARGDDGAKQYYSAGPYPVQAVRPCSWPECTVLKCSGNRVQDIEGFFANAPNKTKLRVEIEQNFALITAMIKAHPCLKSDFQVYLRNDGAVLNIDLDRCKRSSEKCTGDFKRCKRSQKRKEKVRLRQMDRDIYLSNETITLTTQPLKLTCRNYMKALEYPG